VKEIRFSKSKSYLFTTAYHVMIDTIRRDQHMESYDASKHHTGHHHQPLEYNLKEVIDDALSRLPEIQRSVVLLRDYEGYSYGEIGEITGLNESQVKVYIYRARITMKNYLGKLENVL
jgi:RNA polymerase sigma-70 factor (ECF subfamily)